MALLTVIASRKAALAIGGAVLTAGLLGATALANVPADTTAPTTNSATAQKGDRDHKAFDRIADVLRKLVDRGVITAQQKDAILDALKAADKHHDRGHERGDARGFLGDVLQASSQYLGVSADDLKAQLRAGKSLAEIANATPGKSRDGLIDALTRAANAHLKQAVDAGKLTAEQAEKLRATLGAAIVKIVDHSGRPTAT